MKHLLFILTVVVLSLNGYAQNTKRISSKGMPFMPQTGN